MAFGHEREDLRLPRGGRAQRRPHGPANVVRESRASGRDRSHGLEDLLDPGHLREETLCPMLEGGDVVARIRVGAQHDEGRAGGVASEQFQPIHLPGQPDVAQDDIWGLGLDQPRGRGTVLSGSHHDHIELAAHQRREALGDSRVILDYRKPDHVAFLERGRATGPRRATEPGRAGARRAGLPRGSPTTITVPSPGLDLAWIVPRWAVEISRARYSSRPNPAG